MNTFDGVCIDPAGFERAQAGLTHHVGNVLALARPGLGEVGLIATQDVHRSTHVLLPFSLSRGMGNLPQSDAELNARCPQYYRVILMFSCAAMCWNSEKCVESR